MNIATMLDGNARRFARRIAIVDARGPITFQELNDEAARMAGDLARAGLSAGMRALVLSPMSIDLYVTLIAMFRLGVTAVFVDPSAGSNNLAACLERTRPDAFVAVPRAHLLRLTSAAVRSIPVRVMIGRRRSSASLRSIEPGAGDAPAIITFTSGTTGAPKAAVRTHGFLIAQHRAIADGFHLQPPDVDLTTLPIFLLANLASGLTSVIPDADLRYPGRIDAAPVVDQIRRTQATRTVASPALLERLAARIVFERRPLATMRRVFTGGAPVFPKTLDAIAAMAPAASVVAVYGSTEAEPIASIDGGQITAEDRRAMQLGAGLLVGRPAGGIDVRIAPDRWGSPVGTVEDGFEGIGEIVVSADHVLTGYLDGAGDEETKIAAAGRVWHRTGDAGYFDSHGRLWLLGRCAAKVSDDSGVLYPFAVECAASSVTGVRRAAFLQRCGSRVLAVEAEAGAQNLRPRILRELEWAKLAEVIFIDRIPVDRRHNAKVDLPALERVLA